MPRPRRPKHSQKRRTAVKAGFRSGFEQEVSLQLEANDVEYEYEKEWIKYEVARKYKPDFVLSNGIVLEVKGRFTGSDRSKHLMIKKQHPDRDIRFVFMVDNTLSPASDTRYSEWCDKHGFQYCFVNIPEEWLYG